MAPKRLNSLITFQRKIKQEGPFQPLDGYEDYASVFAEARYLRGRNFYSARASNIKTDVEFIIRHKADIAGTMRIQFNNRYYEIDGILPLDSHNMYMMIRASEIQYDM